MNIDSDEVIPVITLLIFFIKQSEAVSTAAIICDIKPMAWYGRIYDRIFILNTHNRAFYADMSRNAG